MSSNTYSNTNPAPYDPSFGQISSQETGARSDGFNQDGFQQTGKQPAISKYRQSIIPDEVEDYNRNNFGRTGGVNCKLSCASVIIIFSPNAFSPCNI
jgi:hypothetical protein